MTELLITTKGKDGSTIEKEDVKIDIPAAKPEQVIDPTGAGDAYRAAIIYGLLNDLDLETTGRIASMTGVYAVEQQGTQVHHYSVAQFEKRYKENFKKNINIS